MKKNFLLLGCTVLTIGILLQSSGLAATVIKSCNVSAFKPATGTTLFGWVPERGVDDSFYTVTHGIEEPDGYWRVDLGQEFDVDYLILDSRAANPNRTNGAYLQAFDSSNTLIGSPIRFSGYTNEIDSLTWDNGGAGWEGVQYFQIGGEDEYGIPLGVPCIHVREFQVFAEVECNVYDGFIDGVTVTDNGTIYEHSASSTEFITTGSGMTDKHGDINGPDALSYCAIGGFWLSNSTVDASNTAVLTFDLNGSHNLGNMTFWNLNHPGNFHHGFKDVIIRTSTDGVTYTDIPDLNDTELGNFTLEMVPETTVEGDTVGNQGIASLSGITAGYVQVEVLNGQGAENSWGISEVRFYETEGSPKIPGDANGDDKVDGSDVTILAGNWQVGIGGVGGANWGMGDFNNDGMVDGSDVTILAGNWQYGVESAALAVPEPSTLAMMLLAMLSLTAMRFMNRARKNYCSGDLN